MAVKKRIRFEKGIRSQSGDLFFQERHMTGATLADTTLLDSNETEAAIYDADVALNVTITRDTRDILDNREIDFFVWPHRENNEAHNNRNRYKIVRHIEVNDFTTRLFGERQTC